ncbi:kinase-like domain-containing protein [Panaeolus papilionaceus]|nr:kinase-like domain-containing protein [Panaeolus papilionaceus]
MANEGFHRVRHYLLLTPGIALRLFLKITHLLNLAAVIYFIKALHWRLSALRRTDDSSLFIDETHPITGGLSDVHKGYLNGKVIAVKRVRINQENKNSVFRAFLHEANVMVGIQHPHILGITGIAFINSYSLSILLPWMKNGTIIQFLQTYPQAPRFPLIEQVVEAMCYLKSVHIVHGDLKGANVLISEREGALLADFGHARRIVSSTPPSGCCNWWWDRLGGLLVDAEGAADERTGTVQWMAPELHCPERWGLTCSLPTFSSDVFSLGMLIYEIYTGNIPFFECTTSFIVIIKIVQGHRPSAAGIHGALRPTVVKCWAENPGSRPAVEHVQGLLSNLRHFCVDM